MELIRALKQTVTNVAILEEGRTGLLTLARAIYVMDTMSRELREQISNCPRARLPKVLLC